MSQRRRAAWTIGAFALIPLVGLGDHWSNPDVSFPFLYIAPIALIAWVGSRRIAVAASAISTLSWFAADFMPTRVEPHFLFYAWNFGSRLLPLLLISIVVSMLGDVMRRDHELSRTDSLTGAMNRRGFREAAERELSRASRRGEPLALVYIDIDDFKRVNDTQGHDTGDRLLKAVASTIARSLRASDGLARIGGDEFAILLPGAGPEDAHAVVEKLQRGQRDLSLTEGIPVTFSVGVVVCRQPPASLDVLLQAADRQMYDVKLERRNGARFAEYSDVQPQGASPARSGSASSAA